jgi:hypothetical protein
MALAREQGMSECRNEIDVLDEYAMLALPLFRLSLCPVAMESVLTACVIYHQEFQNLLLRTWPAIPLPLLQTIFRDRSPSKGSDIVKSNQNVMAAKKF